MRLRRLKTPEVMRYCSETSNGIVGGDGGSSFTLTWTIGTISILSITLGSGTTRPWRTPGRLAGIVILEAGQSWVTDAGLVNLGMLTNLSFLDLEESDVSDAGLIHLEGLTRLSTLGLRGTRVTDAGLENFTAITDLRLLTTELAWRPDGGPAQLEGTTKLSKFSPNEPQVTAAGIKKLEQALPTLRIERY